MWFITFIDFHMLNHPCIPGPHTFLMSSALRAQSMSTGTDWTKDMICDSLGQGDVNHL
jgi:hypothetical protein